MVSSFGPHILNHIRVWTDEVKDGQASAA
jgi:hypothetical protein